MHIPTEFRTWTYAWHLTKTFGRRACSARLRRHKSGLPTVSCHGSVMASDSKLPWARASSSTGSSRVGTALGDGSRLQRSDGLHGGGGGGSSTRPISAAHAWQGAGPLPETGPRAMGRIQKWLSRCRSPPTHQCAAGRSDSHAYSDGQGSRFEPDLLDRPRRPVGKLGSRHKLFYAQGAVHQTGARPPVQRVDRTDFR